WSMRWRTRVRSPGSGISSWVATVDAPTDFCVHAHDRPVSTDVTVHTSLGNLGWMISNRRPGSSPSPSRAVSRVTEAVHSGHRSTSENTSHTTPGGASISMLLSVIMYQMVHD